MNHYFDIEYLTGILNETLKLEVDYQPWMRIEIVFDEDNGPIAWPSKPPKGIGLPELLRAVNTYDRVLELVFRS